MSEKLLYDAFEALYNKQFSEYDDPPEHKFSLKHRIRMRSIFAGQERGRRKLSPPSRLGIRRRLTLAVLIVILMIILTGCAVVVALYFYSQSFNGTVFKDNTQLFAVNVEGAPETIRQRYHLTELPEGFEEAERIETPYDVYLLYRDSFGQTIILFQQIKGNFTGHFNTEYRSLEEVEING